MEIGYHKIRGLGAPLRMMAFYKEADFKNVAFGADMKETWFGGKKPELAKKNACINLPYIQDGDVLVTQSNTCMIYLGKKLSIDTQANKWHNHCVLDQVMDLRNDLMKVVYDFSPNPRSKDEFPGVAKKHIEESAKTNFTKLEGFCRGPYMCGSKPESGDFHVFEMLDQHHDICKSVGVADLMDSFPKLKTLHATMKAEPTLAKYFAHDCYKNYAQNNGLFTHFTGQSANFEYGNMVDEQISFGATAKPAAAAATAGYTLYYHTECKGFYGRAWAPYAMLKHAKKDFEVKASDQCPAGVGFAPPMLSSPAGWAVGQTNTICEMLGKELGLAPKSAADDAKAQQLVADTGDVFSEVMEGKPAERLNKWLDYVESNLQANGYFSKDGLTYVDFAMYPLFGIINMKLKAGKLEGVKIPAKLEKWTNETMPAVAAVKEMNASGVPLLPPTFI